MSDDSSNEPLVFESHTDRWFGVGCGIVFAILAAVLLYAGLSAGTVGEPVGVSVLFVVGMAIWLIVDGYLSRHLGGLVKIENGVVRVYKTANSKPDTLIFESPYSEFENVQVEYSAATEGGGPWVGAYLVHESLDLRRIQLFFKESKVLDEHDRHTVARVAREVGVPILDDRG